MAEQSSSPFSGLGLDKRLLRSTSPPPEAGTSPAAAPVQPAPRESVTRPDADQPQQQARPKAATQARTATRAQASTLASKVDMVEVIRKTVKTPGKEVAYVRPTPAEKAELADIVYALKRKGYRTTENEISRIAVNLIINDYRDQGAA